MRHASAGRAADKFDELGHLGDVGDDVQGLPAIVVVVADGMVV